MKTTIGKLHRIIRNLKVTDAAFDTDGAGLAFDNGTTLAIYNRFELDGISTDRVSDLIGSSVSDVTEGANTITIEFEGRFAIRIDMRDAAYHGPEAMQLRVPGEPIVIWN